MDLETCSICLERKEDFRTSCCRQPYCFSCIVKSVYINNTCPTCRTHIHTEITESPGEVATLPSYLLERGNLQKLRLFFLVRLREHAKKMWEYAYMDGWEKLIKGRLEGEIFSPQYETKTALNEDFLTFFDSAKMSFFNFAAAKLRDFNAIDPKIVKIELDLSETEDDSIINFKMVLHFDLKKGHIEFYYEKPTIK